MTSLPYQPEHWPWVDKHFPDGIDLVVEVGSDCGEWAFGLLENCMVDRLFCIDRWTSDKRWQLWKKKMKSHSHRVCPIPGFSVDVSMRFFHTIDLLYIDGNHHEVFEDVTAWWPHVRNGGIVLFHDWQLHGVRKAIQRFFDPKRVTIELFGPREWEKSAWVVKEDA